MKPYIQNCREATKIMVLVVQGRVFCFIWSLRRCTHVLAGGARSVHGLATRNQERPEHVAASQLVSNVRIVQYVQYTPKSYLEYGFNRVLAWNYDFDMP